MEDKNKNFFFSKKGRVLLALSLFVLFFSSLGLYYFVFAPNWSWLENIFASKPAIETIEELPIVASTSPVCPECQPRWLDGMPVAATATNVFPVAVVVDNDILARPQAGLSQASLVYEAPVEGGMTRFLAIFPADVDLSAVGPIRSARPYFVAWAEELGALFVHCGGSPEALEAINSASLYDLNEFYNSAYFWRDQSSARVAPHNVLSNGEKISSYLDKRGLVEKKADTWLFKEEGEHASSSPDLKIHFSLNFQALWRYDANSNSYLRFFNGNESQDESRGISAKNIIVHYLESKVLDAAGRLSLSINGSGQALICLDGICQPGEWRKSVGNRTRYYYENGEEIKLNPGVTWIEVADSNTSVQ